jgi:UDP:flavonoid glycosyltransferase YjiC (YdhE family)
MITPGTRGDVAPAAGLGARLRAAGHEVTVAANAPYAGVVAAAGCRWHELPGDLRPIVDLTPAEGRPPPAGIRAYLRHLAEYMDLAADGTLAAASAGADVVLVNSVAPFGCDLAEGLGVPSAGLFLQPVQPSSAYPPVVLGSSRGFGPLGNRLAGLAVRAAPAPSDRACARVRRDLGLPPESRRAAQRRRRRAGWPTFHGFSPAVVPRPRDWPPELSMAGYWWPAPSDGWQPPPALADFLAAGPPPVFVGFGSTGALDGDLVVAAVRRAGVRAVVQGGPTAPGDDLFAAGDVPHDWLFPRTAAVVHHGGAGTTAAGLRAGVPAVIVPRYTDQPFWARRVSALGAGPAPLRHRRLTADTLATAIRAAVTKPDYLRNARAISAHLEAEDGALPVLAWLDRLPAPSAAQS